MRVITGVARGRRLKAPKGMNTRPTADRVKEALFNILGEKVIDAVFLDLFAGTGSIGIEALSRGAKEAVFIENNTEAYKTILDNLNLTGFSNESKVYRQDVHKILGVLGKDQTKFDIIFVDPPYLKGHEELVLNGLIKNNLINEGGVVVIEVSSRDELPLEVLPLVRYREQSYGDTKLLFYGDIMQ